MALPPERELYWTRLSNTNYILIERIGPHARGLMSVVHHTLIDLSTNPWLVAMCGESVAIAQFSTLTDAKNYCEVTATLCGS